MLFTYLHLAADEALTRALVESGTTAVAYETVETENRALPAAGPDERDRGAPRSPGRAPTSSRSRSAAADSCSAAFPGVAAGEVVVIGGGMVGYNSARDRARPRSERDDPRALDRPDAPPRGGPRDAGQPADVVEPADRGVGGRGRRGHRRGAHPRRARAEARHAGDGRGDEGGLGRLRRRHRPGRLLRDLARNDAFRARLRGRRRDPLLRCEHARSGSDHVHQGAHERNPALRRGDRRPGPSQRRSPGIRRSPAASTCSRAR